MSYDDQLNAKKDSLIENFKNKPSNPHDGLVRIHDGTVTYDRIARTLTAYILDDVGGDRMIEFPLTQVNVDKLEKNLNNLNTINPIGGHKSKSKRHRRKSKSHRKYRKH